LHLFTVYGQRDPNESFFNQIIKAANLGLDFPSTPGQQLISLTHIDDVLECILRILNENLPKIYKVSFWSTPPMKLVEAIDNVLTVSNPGFNVLYGARSYSGHELFTYSPEIFPPQIYPDYKFLDFADGVARCLESD
jgi:nucleoside-diphosphate-sugar epimerase